MNRARRFLGEMHIGLVCLLFKWFKWSDPEHFEPHSSLLHFYSFLSIDKVIVCITYLDVADGFLLILYN